LRRHRMSDSTHNLPEGYSTDKIEDIQEWQRKKRAKPLTLAELEAASQRLTAYTQGNCTDDAHTIMGHLDEVVGLLEEAVAQLADTNRRLDRIDAIVEDALRDIAPKLDAIKAAVLSATPDPDDNKDKGACIDSQYPDGRTLAGTG